MTISLQTIYTEDANSKANDAHYIECIQNPMSKTAPKKKRLALIAKEMRKILEGAQDYLLRNMLDDDLSDEAKNALYKAAHNAAYVDHEFCNIDHKMIYYPSCADLIQNDLLLVEAEKHYYQDKDKFPEEYSQAVRSAVRAAERKRRQSYKQILHSYDAKDLLEDLEESESRSYDDLASPSMHIRLDTGMVEQLAESWRDNITLECTSVSDDDFFSETDE